MKSKFAQFHLIRLETLLRNSGLGEVTLDDDGEESFWLDVATDKWVASASCSDEGYKVEVWDLEGNLLREHGSLELDGILPFLQA